MHVVCRPRSLDFERGWLTRLHRSLHPQRDRNTVSLPPVAAAPSGQDCVHHRRGKPMQTRPFADRHAVSVEPLPHLLWGSLLVLHANFLFSLCDFVKFVKKLRKICEKSTIAFIYTKT